MYSVRVYVCVHLTLVQVFITHKANMLWRLSLHQSTSLAESQKAVEAHGCKPWVTNSSIIPHTSLTTNVAQ